MEILSLTLAMTDRFMYILFMLITLNNWSLLLFRSRINFYLFSLMVLILSVGLRCLFPQKWVTSLCFSTESSVSLLPSNTRELQRQVSLPWLTSWKTLFNGYIYVNKWTLLRTISSFASSFFFLLHSHHTANSRHSWYHINEYAYLLWICSYSNNSAHPFTG